MTEHISKVGAFTDAIRRIINRALGDYSRCTTQFLVDSGSTGTTLTNVPGLVTDILLPGTYEFEINLITTATTNSGIKAALKQSVAGLVSSIRARMVAHSASAVASSSFSTTTDAATFVGATSAYVNVMLKGIIVIAVPGTLQLQAAQNASHADDTTVETDSYMIFKKIA